jgi:hypothetical protein
MMIWKMILVQIIWLGLKAGEDYIEEYDILDNDFKIKELWRSDTTLLVTRRIERQHPIEVLNDIEMFDCLITNEDRLGPDDESTENII